MEMIETLWDFPDYEFEPERIDEMLLACYEHARCPTDLNRESAIAVFGYSTTLIGQAWCKSCNLVPTQELHVNDSRVLNDLERCVIRSYIWPEGAIADAIGKLVKTEQDHSVSDLRGMVVELLRHDLPAST